MTKRDATKLFNSCYDIDKGQRPFHNSASERTGKLSLDRPMRNEAWGAFTDMLCKDGSITPKQYNTWTTPWKD